MKIVGCDLHTRYQQIAMLDTETGELIERRLEHAHGEARAFYASLQGQVRVGMVVVPDLTCHHRALTGGRVLELALKRRGSSVF